MYELSLSWAQPTRNKLEPSSRWPKLAQDQLLCIHTLIFTISLIYKEDCLVLQCPSLSDTSALEDNKYTGPLLLSSC